MTRYLLVGNPTARSGKAAARIERALAAMRARGWDAELLATEPEGRTVGLVRDAVRGDQWDVVVYMGGDGTFAEVAKGVLLGNPAGAASTGQGVKMGMLPSGTANDQGKSFGIGASESALEANLDIIEADHAIAMDVGRVDRLDDSDRADRTELFFDNVGWGLQSDILSQRNRDREVVSQIPLLRDVYRDQAVYAGAAVGKMLGSYLEPTKFDVTVEADERRVVYVGLTDLVINNTPVYAGSWVLDRLSDPDDGVFELAPFQGRFDMLSKGIRDLKDLPIWEEHLEAIGLSHSKGMTAAGFDLTFRREGREQIDCQIDGEEWCAGRFFRVQVLAGKLPLIVREDWVPHWKIR